MNIIEKSVFALFVLLIPCTNNATELCTDIQFTIINDSDGSINHSHANNPTNTNSKAIKSEQVKLKKYLSCSSKLLLKTYPTQNKPDISKFDTHVLNSIKNSKMENKYIAKAIYFVARQLSCLVQRQLSCLVDAEIFTTIFA